MTPPKLKDINNPDRPFTLDSIKIENLNYEKIDLLEYMVNNHSYVRGRWNQICNTVEETFRNIKEKNE